MLILVSLPYEKNLSLDSEVEAINRENDLEALRIDIPVFSGVSLENIIKYEEKIEKMDFNVTDLCKRFIKRSGAYQIPFEYKQLSWDTEKYSCTTIEGCLTLISEDIERIRTNYLQKESHHLRMIKDYDDAQRKTKGSLLEMDISVILEERREYEFLKEVYILVEVEEINKFKQTIENTSCLSEEAIETVASDEKHVLYKAVVIKNMESELKKILIANNFILKEDMKKEGVKTPQEKIKHFEENKDNLQVFIDTHRDEALTLLIHTNLLKLFIESIYRYGLPIKYFYFVCKESTSVIKKLRSVGDNWESERMVGDDEYSGQEEQDLNIAKSFLGFKDESSE